jgi:hypothetical protein
MEEKFLITLCRKVIKTFTQSNSSRIIFNEEICGKNTQEKITKGSSKFALRRRRKRNFSSSQYLLRKLCLLAHFRLKLFVLLAFTLTPRARLIEAPFIVKTIFRILITSSTNLLSSLKTRENLTPLKLFSLLIEIILNLNAA